MTILVEDLVEGWETLQMAATNRDRAARSRVRLNKHLAFLQREGYPIPIRFHNIDMGPASKEVDKRAVSAEEEGLLVINEEKKEGMSARVDYELTDDGHQYVIEHLVPALKKHERGNLYWQIFTTVMSEYQFKKNDDLIREIHLDLHLDDREEFVTEYAELRKEIESWLTKITEEWRPRHDVDLAAAAAVELASMSLEAIKSDVADEDDHQTGKHNVVWNARRLSNLLQVKEGLEREGDGPDNSLAHSFDKILNAIEVNCAIYGYLDIPNEEEIEAMFQEAPVFDPDELTY